MQNILDVQIAFFRKHQAELAEKHHGESALIHAESIIGTYPSDTDAYADAIDRGLKPGTFLIRQCLRSEEEKPVVLRSRVA